MRHQQNEAGKEQQAKHAELDIAPALEKSVPSAEMLGERHQGRQNAGQDHHCATEQKPFLAHMQCPFGILPAAIKTAAQTWTTRFPANFTYEEDVTKEQGMSRKRCVSSRHPQCFWRLEERQTSYVWSNLIDIIN